MNPEIDEGKIAIDENEKKNKDKDNEKPVYIFNASNQELIKVFLPKFDIDRGTMDQIKRMANNPDFLLKHIRIMPDCHKGHMCCVGMTAQIEEKVFPRHVGVDIGCGISMYPYNVKLKPRKIPKIEEAIRSVVPMGKGGYNTCSQIRDVDWEWLCEKCNIDLENLKKNIGEKYPTYNFPEKINREWIEKMLKKIGCNLKKDIKSIGTLGGGNHYVEINAEKDADGNMKSESENVITVHSGSRNIGYKICHYHQAIIDDNSKINMIEYTKQVKHIRRTNKVSKVVKELEENLRNKMRSELHPKYLEGDEMLDYLVDMIVGQNIASLNRAVMIRNILESTTNCEFKMDKILETRHNYIDFNRFLLRKGAISAENGEICIVSLNMRDGILLCKGKGNPDWNYSSAHGCGRLLNRAQASRLNMKTFIKEMENVYSTCVKKETLDESPMAYRDPELVKRCLGDSVTILKQLKPIINCKGLN